jgi:hypothetical protein
MAWGDSGPDIPGYAYERRMTGGGRTSAQIPAYNWVNTLLGNVENATTGSYHAIRGQQAPHYLAEIPEFNRRYDHTAMILHFLQVPVRASPMPYRFLKATSCNPAETDILD